MRFPYFGHGLDRGRAISGPAKDRGIEIGGTSSAPTAGATNSRPPKPGREFLDPWLYRSRLGPANTGFPIYKLTPAGSSSVNVTGM